MAAQLARLATRIRHMTRNLLLAFTFSALAAVAAAGTQVSGERAVPSPKAMQQSPAFRMAAVADSAAARTTLAPLPANEAAAIVVAGSGDEKRIRVGVRRDVNAAAGAKLATAPARWVIAGDGSQAMRVSLSSPGAQSLRLALSIRGLPANAEMRFAGTVAAQPVGPIAGSEGEGATRAQGLFWTPVTEGDTQTVEIWLPRGIDSSAVRIEVRGASHIGARASDGFKLATGQGASGACEQDVACMTPMTDAFANATRSVAKMVFTEDGATYICSGTLLNDTDTTSQVPYFFTAAHCIGSQAAASTLNTYWYFQAAACQNKSAGDYTQLSGGATLLYANANSDAALLRLKDNAPDGAWFSGWDSTPLVAGSAIVAIHHPAGDLKKVSIGQAVGVQAGAAGASFSSAGWLAGSTEPGSSGSGLFTVSGSQYVLRGGLKGGSASCGVTGNVNDSSNRDFYSRMDLEGDNLRAWLAGGITPTEDYTDLWWNPAEAGWGISITHHVNNNLFLVWFTYDANGKPEWIVAQGGKWTGSTTWTGTMYRTSGPPSGGKFDPSLVHSTPIGTATLAFPDADNGTLQYVVEGRSGMKSFTRQQF
jgi:lysyl endopeptidase